MQYLSLGEIKQIELDILIKFDAFCKKENLYYTLAGGTLLGAIRHKGFIPWDDDIDVIMSRDDYNRFLKVFTEKNLSGSLSLLKPGDKEYYYPFAKLCDNKTFVQMENNTSMHGIWVDIFPADDLPKDELVLKKLFKKARFWRAVIISMTTRFSGEKSIKKRIAKSLLMIFANIIGKEKVVQKSSKLSQIYNGTNSEYLGVVVWGYGSGERMNKGKFFSACKVKFENHFFNAPSCWHEYLEGIYGNYMQLPPEEERKAHHLKAWRINQ